MVEPLMALYWSEKMISSLVSFARRDISEDIPGLQRGNYFLPASKDNRPSILHVNDSFYYKPDIDGNQDRILVPSEQIVNSVAHMHITSQLLYKMDQHPALFSVPNREVDEQTVLTEFKEISKDLLARQRRWFTALVRLADDDWQSLRKHKMISDIQRTAAIELGLNREWLNAVHEEDKNEVDCPFCGSALLNPNAPICPHCGKVHNPEKLAELEARIKKVNPATGR